MASLIVEARGTGVVGDRERKSHCETMTAL